MAEIFEAELRSYARDFKAYNVLMTWDDEWVCLTTGKPNAPTFKHSRTWDVRAVLDHALDQCKELFFLDQAKSAAQSR